MDYKNLMKKIFQKQNSIFNRRLPEWIENNLIGFNVEVKFQEGYEFDNRLYYIRY